MRDRPLALAGGTIADGTGSDAYPGTVLVENGRIIEILKSSASVPTDFSVLDCTGLMVSPGFIDTHSHADNAPFLRSGDASKIEQGVTTEVTGNCGFSLAPIDPLNKEAAHSLLSRIFPPIDFTWSSSREFFEAAADVGYVTNHAPLVGHNMIRIASMGAGGRKAERDEILRMQKELESALHEGAFGLSSGLIYPPGLFSDSGELRALTTVLGSNRVYTTHMRNESTGIVKSIHESLTAAGNHCRLHVSHLKVADAEQWGRMGEVLAILDQARVAGQTVSQDAYPYAAGSTMLTALLPPWFHDGGTPAVLARLDSAEARARARHDIEHDRTFENIASNAGWDGVVISSTSSHRYEGRSIVDIARGEGIDPFDGVVKILREEQLNVTMTVHYMHDDDVRTALQHPWTAIGSDGLPPGTGGKAHPRAFGTFPRMLGHYGRSVGLFDVTEAVRKSTGLAAEIFGLTDRGHIRRGAIADITVFNPDTVLDTATYDEPEERPIGIEYVVLGGRVTVRQGRWLGVREGRRLSAS